MTHVDGNALAGMLDGALGIDSTLLRMQCEHCGRATLLAEAMVTFDGPGPAPGTETGAGAVAHCPHCTGVLLTISSHGDAVELNVRGIRSITLPRDDQSR